MIEKIKDNLIAKNRELKARINTLELENELLKDKRLDELIKSLDKQNKYERNQEMARKSHKGYWYIPIEYIEELAKLREKIRKIKGE